MMYMQNKKLALLWSLTQIVFTSGMFLTVKYLLNAGVDPLNFSYQILIAAALLLLAYGLYNEPNQIFHLSIRTISVMALIGVIGSGLVYGLGGLGLKYSTVTNYSFLSQTAVFFITMLAFFFLKENLKPMKVALLCLLLLGVYLIATKGNLIVPAKGDLFVLIAALAYAIASVLAKIALRNVPTLTFTAYRLFFGGVSLILFLLLIGRFSVDINWLWTLGVGAMISISTLAIHKVLVYATASYMSMMATMISVLTAITAWALLGETMNTAQVIGGGFIVLAGIFMNRTDI